MIFFSEQLEEMHFEHPEREYAAFIVARLDTQKVTCVSGQDFPWKYLIPSYDLGSILHKILHEKIIIVRCIDKLRIPRGGFAWNWTSEWQMTNFKTELHAQNLFFGQSNGMLVIIY